MAASPPCLPRNSRVCMFAFFWACHQTSAASSGLAIIASPHFFGPKRIRKSLHRGHAAERFDWRFRPPSSSGKTSRPLRSPALQPQNMQVPPVMLLAFSTDVPLFTKAPFSDGERPLSASLASPSGLYASLTRSSGTNQGTLLRPSTRQAGGPCMPGIRVLPKVASMRSRLCHFNSSKEPMTRFSTRDRLLSACCQYSWMCAEAAPGVTPGSVAAQAMATASMRAARPARPSWESTPSRARFSCAMLGGTPSMALSSVSRFAIALLILVIALCPCRSGCEKSQV
mmetsp:Transcript_90584/g.265116  ORF Transcript_90584/g.265116 Transcript_90584/m.265116 type:complete len:284 (+) Transcript_90584:163-1014(+)